MIRYTNNRLSAMIVSTLILLAVTALPARAQGGQDLGTFTLQETIEIAQDQSPEARLARFDLIARRWQYRAYRANLLPGLELSGQAPNYSRSIVSNQLDDGTIVFQSQIQSQADAALSLNQNIPLTGGRLSVISDIGRLGVFNGEDNYLWRSTPLQAQLFQPLFQYNQLKWDDRIEPLRYEIAQKEYIQNMEEIARFTTQQFFNTYLAQVQLENARFNVVSNDSIYTINEVRYRTGDISESDLLQSRLQLKNAQVSLSNAEINYERVLDNFKIFLGYSTDVTLELSPPDELPEIEVQINRAVELAMQNNNEALLYELQELQADAAFARAKSESSLQMNMTASYGISNTAEDFPALYENTNNSQFLNVSFQIPIFNWGRQRAFVQQARNQQQRTATLIDYQRQQFIQNVEIQVKEFLQRDTQVENAAESDRIAQRRYDMQQTRYLIGTLDIEFLFQAQSSRDAARVAYIQELRQFWAGLYNLRSLTLYDFQNNRMIDHDL